MKSKSIKVGRCCVAAPYAAFTLLALLPIHYSLLTCSAFAQLSGLERPPEVTRGLVARWRFDEVTGTIASDAIRINNGHLTNGASFTAGAVGASAVSFDGVDDYVEVPTTLQSVGTGDFAISLWFKVDASGRDDMLCWKSSDGSDDVGLYVSATNKIIASCKIDGVNVVCVGATTISAGTLYHVVMQRLAGTLTLFLNAQAEGNIAATANLANHGTSRLWIGSNHTSFSPLNDFNHAGFIDDVRIYNRALSASEVTNIYRLRF